MCTVRAMRKKLQSINLDAQYPKIIESDESYLVGLNQEQLFKSSVDSLGVPLPPYKSKVYAAYKVFKNPGIPFGATDLKDTGAFYRGFYVTAGYTGIFTFGSTDSKASKLEAKYGVKIFGLTKANKITYAQGIFKDKLIAYIRGKLKL